MAGETFWLSMKNNITKNQHFVPQFYLNQFVDSNNCLYCYDKHSQKRFNAHPADICFRKFGYETKLPEPISGNKFLLPNDIENMFVPLEGQYNQVLSTIVRKCEANCNGQALICTTEEKEILASMVSNFIIRNPNAVNDCTDEDEIETLIESNEEINSIDKLLREMNLGTAKPFVELAQKRIFFDPKEKGIAKSITDELLKMNLSFFVTENSDFITSDCPVGYNCTNENMIMARIPLNPKITAVYSISDNSKQFRNKACKIKNHFVLKLNRDYLNWSISHKIISNTDKNIDLLLNNYQGGI